MALWKLLDYISVYRTPVYNLLLPFIRTRVSDKFRDLTGHLYTDTLALFILDFISCTIPIFLNRIGFIEKNWL